MVQAQDSSCFFLRHCFVFIFRCQPPAIFNAMHLFQEHFFFSIDIAPCYVLACFHAKQLQKSGPMFGIVVVMLVTMQAKQPPSKQISKQTSKQASQDVNKSCAHDVNCLCCPWFRFALPAKKKL